MSYSIWKMFELNWMIALTRQVHWFLNSSELYSLLLQILIFYSSIATRPCLNSTSHAFSVLGILFSLFVFIRWFWLGSSGSKFSWVILLKLNNVYWLIFILWPRDACIQKTMKNSLGTYIQLCVECFKFYVMGCLYYSASYWDLLSYYYLDDWSGL